MQLVRKFNKGTRFLLFFIDIFSKYAWIVPLKDEKGITITNALQNIIKESHRKPNKIWVFYKGSMKSWIEKSGIEMCSRHNERKSVFLKDLLQPL